MSDHFYDGGTADIYEDDEISEEEPYEQGSENDEGLSQGEETDNQKSEEDIEDQQTAKVVSSNRSSFVHDFGELRRAYKPGTATSDQVRSALDQLWNTYYEYIKPQKKEVEHYVDKDISHIMCRILSPLNTDSSPTTPFEKEALERLVTKHPELLDVQDAIQNQTPVEMAIQRGLNWFVEIVLVHIPLEKVKQMLGATNEEQEQNPDYWNLVSEAIKKNMDPDLIVKMVKRASHHTLSFQGSPNKFTPLHHAVKLERCTKDRQVVIDALIEHGEAALDRICGKPDEASPYLYLAKKIEGHKKKQDIQKTKGTNPRTNGRNNRVVEQNPNIDSEYANKKFGPSGARKPSPFDNHPEEMKAEERKVEESQLLQKQKGQMYLPPHNQPNKGRRLDQPQTRPSCLLSPAGKRPKSTDKRSGHQRRNQVSIDCAEDIANRLKRHYLRSIFRSTVFTPEVAQSPSDNRRDYSTAVQFLFGKSLDRKILSLDLPPPEWKDITGYTFKDIKTALDHISLDSILLHVRFGQIAFKPTGPGSMQGNDDGSAGRKDLYQLFKWLRETKQVQTILKVTAEDMDSSPHQDQVIIDSLKLFDVEILEWKKIDLCPQVIYEASQEWTNFHELHLQWSGSNAVLRSWSEPEGLARLPNLKNIYINEANKMLNSRSYVEKNIEYLIHRLSQLRKGQDSIQVDHRPFLIPRGQSEDKAIYISGECYKERNHIIDEQEWLTIMDKFALGMSKMDRYIPSILNASDNPSRIIPFDLAKEITVALLDDGIDSIHRAIAPMLKSGRTFPHGQEQRDPLASPAPHFTSTTGHGSWMAYMIGRMCPMVKICVCKMGILCKNNREPSFTARNAAEAVTHAVEQNVNIICMSWTIERDSNNSRDIENLKEALKKASDKGILLFCSAPDKGQDNQSDTHFPVQCDDSIKKFRIGAATQDGSLWQRAGSQVDFILPGDNIGIRKGDPDLRGSNVLKTGSSIATALAAGLAALIIHCVRLGALYHQHHQANLTGRVTVREFQRIQEHEYMKKAFEHIGRSGGKSDGNYIRIGVESFFKKPAQNFSEQSEDCELLWKGIAEMARQLVIEN